jgi:pyrroline-5-carboxylate reductase
MPRLTLFGAGKMGGAMLAGALKAGWPAKDISVVEPFVSEPLATLAETHGFALNPAQPEPADIILLGIKPQMLDSAAAGIAPAVSASTVVVSILAGKSIANLAARLPATSKFVRAMPNTPAAIGRGITGTYATPALTAAERDTVASLLATMGAVEWVANEALIDAVTAVSGSGPAYVFHLVEALAAGGVEAGLPPDLALRLARATVEGAGELMHREPQTPASTLRENVTSPGGTTAAALGVLMGEGGLTPLMTKAVLAALHRAKELAG